MIRGVAPRLPAAPVHEVRPRKTAVSPGEIRAALGTAYRTLTGRAPEPALLDLLSAQAGLETGQGSRMFNYNFGGLKGAGPRGATTHYMTREVGPNAEERHVVDGFRAYASLGEGAIDYLRLLQARYGSALSAASRGDVEGFAGELKKRGYFTEQLAPYAAALRSLVQQGRSSSAAPHEPPAAVEASLPDPQAEAATFPTTLAVERVLDAVASMSARIGAPLDPPEA